MRVLQYQVLGIAVTQPQCEAVFEWMLGARAHAVFESSSVWKLVHQTDKHALYRLDASGELFKSGGGEVFEVAGDQ